MNCIFLINSSAKAALNAFKCSMAKTNGYK